MVKGFQAMFEGRRKTETNQSFLVTWKDNLCWCKRSLGVCELWGRLVRVVLHELGTEVTTAGG